MKMSLHQFLIAFSGALLALSACQKSPSHQPAAVAPVAPPQVVQGDLAPMVVKSRASIVISTNDTDGISVVTNEQFAARGANKNLPINVTNPAVSTATFNVASFKVPKVTNAVLNFGSIAMTGLTDNDLEVCGPTANQRCNNAVIRMYTTGVAGAGLYNDAGKYGMPLTAKLGTNAASAIGLEVANATVVYSYAIPAGQHAVVQANLSPAPTFQMSSDFTNAGAGSYSTTLIIEYGLTL